MADTKEAKHGETSERELLIKLLATLTENQRIALESQIKGEDLVKLVQEARAPYIDPAKEARRRREREEDLRNAEQARNNLLASQEACPHVFTNVGGISGQSSIRLMHNFHDRKPRGYCTLCYLFIQPDRVEYLPSAITKNNPSGQIVLKAHPLYTTHVLRTDLALA